MNQMRLVNGIELISYPWTLKKKRIILFHKNSIKDDIPLKMPGLKIGGNIKKRSFIKFLL